MKKLIPLQGLCLLILSLLTACVSKPDGIEPVDNFDADQYLGIWYEIARLDHSFERGLSHVSASYSTRNDGGIDVINRGFSKEKQQWQQAEGRAYFVENDNIGYLKVSFFGPFYGAYIIFSLDKNYQYSFVAGNNRNYLWLLSRTPNVEQSIIDDFIQQAEQLGFDTSDLILVDQESLIEE